jgi:hypothetical protein
VALTGWSFITDQTPGAPPSNGVNGSGNDLMNWLLVTVGGWSRIFHDAATNQSVFQMPGGSQRCLYVCHDSSVSGDVRRMTVRGCESASGFDYADLVNPFPNTSQVADASSVWLMSSTTNAVARPYRAQVWESGVILMIDQDSNGNWASIGWYVDPFAIYPTDNFCTNLAIRNSTQVGGTNNATLSGLQSSLTSTGNPTVYFCRSIDGLVQSSAGRIICPSGQMGGIAGTPTLVQGYLGQPRHKPVMVSCHGSSTTTSGANAIFERAAIPGVRMPIHNGMGSLTADDFFTDSEYSPGCLLRPIGVPSAPFILSEETNTWEYR